jgi:hypothetical protein
LHCRRKYKYGKILILHSKKEHGKELVSLPEPKKFVKDSYKTLYKQLTSISRKEFEQKRNLKALIEEDKPVDDIKELESKINNISDRKLRDLQVKKSSNRVLRPLTKQGFNVKEVSIEIENIDWWVEGMRRKKPIKIQK